MKKCPMPKFGDTITSTCVSLCSGSTYIEYTQQQCKPCDVSCLSCDGPLATNCLSCTASTYEYYNGSCIN